jgi:hypothetical protein
MTHGQLTQWTVIRLKPSTRALARERAGVRRPGSNVISSSGVRVMEATPRIEQTRKTPVYRILALTGRSDVRVTNEEFSQPQSGYIPRGLRLPA